jgi:AbrB family looped-hinge helix DNA binding protein
MQATVGRKFQITIPAKLRKKLRLKPGMKLLFAEHAPDLRAKPVYDFNGVTMRAALGAAKNFEPAKTSNQILRELRGYNRRSL